MDWDRGSRVVFGSQLEDLTDTQWLILSVLVQDVYTYYEQKRTKQGTPTEGVVQETTNYEEKVRRFKERGHI